MSASYDVIVEKMYETKRDYFLALMSRKYHASKMRKEDMEDIYQDVFMAVYENIALGRVKADTSWEGYIMKIGNNMACKRYQKLKDVEPYYMNMGDADEDMTFSKRVEDAMRNLLEEDEPSRYQDEDCLEVLDRELAGMPEKQRDLIKMHYLEGKRDAEIAAELPGYSSGKSVKVVRNRCMKELSQRVRRALAV